MVIEEWTINDALKKELDGHYKTVYSLSLKTKDPIEIARELTFDGLIESLTINDLTLFLETINKKFLNGAIKGTGLEIGSGPGTFVAAFSRLTSVEKIYGIEACAAIVQNLMGKVVTGLAGNNEHKVTGVIGDFDRLELPDDSVDFVFDFFSLHHSQNPEVTIKEIARVLRPGGVVIAVDKARANEMSKKQLEELLDQEYSTHAKKLMGISPEKYHTRRMNGEHEYRLSDWSNFFEKNNFTKLKHYNVTAIAGRPFAQIIKSFFALLPLSLQIMLTKLFFKKTVNYLEPSNRIFNKFFPLYSRDFSLMFAYKK